MKLINKHKRSAVFYNEETDTFIKKFIPKFSAKLKFFFKFRKYPGENFYYICNLLKKLDIKTPVIVNHSKYSVETEKLDGESLEEVLNREPKNLIVINNYIDILISLLKNNIYCGDLSFDNFIVINNEVYPFDLEDYRHVKFLKRGQDEFLRRLKGKIPPHIFEEVLERLK
ncbi:MAG: RIO1 family regulatory kinase/ATPase [Cetobacterium sp.]